VITGLALQAATSIQVYADDCCRGKRAQSVVIRRAAVHARGAPII
jgi:hypothetical protein